MQSVRSESEIAFRHFGEADLRILDERRKALSILSERPAILDVPNAVVPLLDHKDIHRKELVSGVFDEDKVAVAASSRVRGSDARTSVAAPPIGEEYADDRAAYYLGMEAMHYGHVLLELMARAWAWEEFGADRVPVIQSAAMRVFVKDMLQLIPGLAVSLEPITRTTRFRSVLVPSPAFVVRKAAHLAFKALFERITARTLTFREPRTAQPLYLSRAGLGINRRYLVGEDRIETFLEAQGFRVVRPETLPIAEQIALVNRHEWIVSPIGSACHSKLFALEPANWLVLSTSRINANFFLCDGLAGDRTHYANILVDPDAGLRMNDQPQMYDDERLLETLKALGLVRANAAFTAPAPDLDAFRKTWIRFAEPKTKTAANGSEIAQKIAELKAAFQS